MFMKNRYIQILLLFSLIFSLIPRQFVNADEELPESAYISGYYGYRQYYNLSCEARAAADVASFWGVTITEDEILDAMPSSDNPNKGFVGKRNDYWGNIPPLSYGVHAGPVAAVLQDAGLDAVARTDMTYDEVRAQIADGNPVIVWVIGKMWTGTTQRIEFSDKEQGIVAANEHTMVILGYDKTTVQVFDPSSGAYTNYWTDGFLASWAVLGNMAITVTGMKSEDASAVSTATLTDEPEPEGTPAPEGTPVPEENIYIVQTGDYLIELGKRFNVDWRYLVEINKLPYPWTLFPGDKIRIK